MSICVPRLTARRKTDLSETSKILKSFDPKLERCFFDSASLIAFLVSSVAFLAAPETCFPAAFSANIKLANLDVASKNSFLMKSFTITKSGAYGLVPWKLNLAVTMAFAAASMFAVRSTMAIVRAWVADRISFVLEIGGELEVVWSTSTKDSRSDSLIRVADIPKVSESRAFGKMSFRTESILRVVLSS